MSPVPAPGEVSPSLDNEDSSFDDESFVRNYYAERGGAEAPAPRVPSVARTGTDGEGATVTLADGSSPRDAADPRPLLKGATTSTSGSRPGASPAHKRTPLIPPTQQPHIIQPIVVLPPSIKAIKNKVSSDISKLLANNRAYVQHTRTPPVCHAATLQRVSQPKHFGSDHPDAQRLVDDPTEYALYKTGALREKREVREAVEASERVDKGHQLQDLAAWQTYHVQKRAEEDAAKVAEAVEKEKLGTLLSRHVNSRARSNLKGPSQHQGDLKKFADLVHKQALAQFGL